MLFYCKVRVDNHSAKRTIKWCRWVKKREKNKKEKMFLLWIIFFPIIKTMNQSFSPSSSPPNQPTMQPASSPGIQKPERAPSENITCIRLYDEGTLFKTVPIKPGNTVKQVIDLYVEKYKVACPSANNLAIWYYQEQSIFFFSRFVLRIIF